MKLNARKHRKIIVFTALVPGFVLLTLLLLIPSLVQAGDPSLGTPGNIAELVQAYYKYAIGAVGIVATATMVFGGLLYVMAAGNPSRVENAKAWITSSLTGFVLAMFAYTILYFVNPNLVSFRPIHITKIEKTGCCQIESNRCDNVPVSQCKGGQFFSDGLCNDGKCKDSTTKILGSCCTCLHFAVSRSCTEDKNIKSQEECDTYCGGFFHNGLYKSGWKCRPDFKCEAR